MGKEKVNYGNYAEDCIHLHACRLLAKRYRDAGRQHVARGCNESCCAYESEDDFIREEDFRLSESDTWITTEDAARWARSQAHMIRSGYDEFDVYCARDFALCDTATDGVVLEWDL